VRSRPNGEVSTKAGQLHPAARCCYGFAYDGRNGVLTLFGGATCEEGGSCNTFFIDTWTYDATNGWKCKLGPCSPP